MEGKQPYLGDLLTMVVNHLPNGMILQVLTFKVGVFWTKKMPSKNTTTTPLKMDVQKPGTPCQFQQKCHMQVDEQWKKNTGSCLLGKMPGMKSSDMWGFFHKPWNYRRSRMPFKQPGFNGNSVFFCGSEAIKWIYIHGLKIDPRNLKIVILANLENRPPYTPCLVSQLNVVGQFFPTVSRGPKFCLGAESVIFMNANSTLRIMEKPCYFYRVKSLGIIGGSNES